MSISLTCKMTSLSSPAGLGQDVRPVHPERPQEDGLFGRGGGPLGRHGTSAWEAVEGGRVPETAAQLRLMAGVLQFSNEQLGTMVLLCRDAWEQ